MMKKAFKKLLDISAKTQTARYITAFTVTKVRQNDRLRKLLRKYNPCIDPWAQGCDELRSDLRSKYSVDFQALIINPPNKPIGFVCLNRPWVVDPFVKACQLLGIKYKLFFADESQFVDNVRDSDCQFYLFRPSHTTSLERIIFTERFDAVRDFLGRSTFPRKVEFTVYEAKRQLANFLQAMRIRHPKTFVSFSYRETLTYLDSCAYPVVFKTHSGASSTGVEILYSKKQAVAQVRQLFLSQYKNKALNDYRDLDYGYVLLQDYIKDAREFRVIKIGRSWFGHEKSRGRGEEFMSGSGKNLWTPPSEELLNFCEDLAGRFDFNTMCFDIFQDANGVYYVNELQTWFGSYNPSQMYIEGIPGRYVKENSKWVFEEGLFNDVESLPLRLVSLFNGE